MSRQGVKAVIRIDIAIYCFCLLGLWQVVEKPDFPFSLTAVSGNTFSLSDVSRPAYPSSIENGQIASTFNGMTAGAVEDIEFMLDGHAIGDTVRIGVLHGGGTVYSPVKLVNKYSWFYVAAAWFVGTLFFLSGLLVFTRKPTDMAACIYHFGAMAVAIIIMTTWGRYSIPPAGLGEAIRIVFSAAYAFLPVTLLHLSLVFPSRNRTILTRLITPLYGFSILLSILMGATFIKATLPFSLAWFHRFIFFFNITRWTYAACVFLAILVFINSYRTAREEMERRQIRWLTLGFGTSSLGFVALWQIPQLLTSHGLVSEEIVVLISSATPIAFAIAIVRYHVLDIDYIINRSTVYLMVVGTIICLYAILVGSIAIAVERFTVSVSVFASAVAAVVIALLFEPIRSRAQSFVDKTFFRVKYDMRKIEKKFDEETRDCVSVDVLAKLLVDTINNSIPVQRIGFFVSERAGHQLTLLAHKEFDFLPSDSTEIEFSNLDSVRNVPIVLPERVEPAVKCKPADQELFRKLKIVLVQVMKSDSGAPFGLLLLGEKKAGTRFSIEDVDLLSSLAGHAAKAHDRILLQNRLHFEMEEAKRLEELSKLKTFLIASVSHDLKTPLTNIRMFTEMLKSEKALRGKKTGKYLNVVEGESKRLTRLIDNVLNVAKIERGNVEYHFSPLSLNKIVKEALKVMTYEMQKENCAVQSSFGRGELEFEGNHDAVVEALDNVLSNAVQYSHKKKIIRVSTFMHKGYCCVSVKDSGIGIPAEELPHVFEPFNRGKATSNFRPSGTGLGLAVVKNVVDAHKGRIEIESTPNVGTTVTLLFPVMEQK